MTYQERRAIYRAYQRMKVWEDDEHGASDAANDIRELDAEESGYQRGLRERQRESANGRPSSTSPRCGPRGDARESSGSGADLRISSICEAGEEEQTS